MNPTITVKPTKTIPDDAHVRQYDELDGSAKQQFPSVVERGERALDAKTALQFSDGEFVKYVGYYQISLS
ncbi:hypothetical protein SAMN05421858_2251 [Haladaptatus litoreus]|uniref:DUF7979 domain-containing protein n=1 Tax=Haladaptatus litoreus TaxID=553468 RepID=A0A1N6ZZW2_9EURY|nr:hypothetical protein [Haladaptatus litoreus]SIR32364.1 hypothetical protein SAMN05421858_2251 [Haladaptatus litoreus]